MTAVARISTMHRCLGVSGSPWLAGAIVRWLPRPHLAAKGAKRALSSPATSLTPPSFLLPTGSPHVYIAKSAAHAAGIDPRLLYRDVRPLTTRYRYAGTAIDDQLPKVAVIGRSNVGKSSLLNAIMRENLARVSKQPGRTQTPHLFVASNGASDSGALVDLPGYGYAVGPAAAIDAWQASTQDLLSGNPSIRRVFLLLDSRHAMGDLDGSVLRWLDEANVPCSLVWTKADAVGRATLLQRVNQSMMRYTSGATTQSPVVFVTSARARTGLAEVFSAMQEEWL